MMFKRTMREWLGSILGSWFLDRTLRGSIMSWRNDPAVHRMRWKHVQRQVTEALKGTLSAKKWLQVICDSLRELDSGDATCSLQVDGPLLQIVKEVSGSRQLVSTMASLIAKQILAAHNESHQRGSGLLPAQHQHEVTMSHLDDANLRGVLNQKSSITGSGLQPQQPEIERYEKHARQSDLAGPQALAIRRTNTVARVGGLGWAPTFLNVSTPKRALTPEFTHSYYQDTIIENCKESHR